MSTLSDLTDEELVELCVLGKEDAETELFRRYKIHSKKMAGELYQAYCNCSKVEFDDLVSIGLFSFYNALTKYYKRQSFFKYWKKIAYFDMLNEIKTQSISFILSDMNVRILGYDENIDYKIFADDTSEREKEMNRIIAFNEACKKLQEEKSPLDPLSIDVFLYYLDGYKLTEIAKQLNISYSKARRIFSDVVFILKNHFKKK